MLISIVGGGPGGLTLARLLQLRGAEVQVYERDVNEDARVQGTTLDLHEESGLAALRVAGLMEAFKKNYRPGAEKIRIVDANGKVFFDEHDGSQDDGFGGKYSRPEIDRGPLRKMLLESLKPGTVIWDSQFVSMERKGEGWQLHFKNGTESYADIVIGADGANSRVRPYLTPIATFYTGVWGIEGAVYKAETATPNIYSLLGGGKIFAFGGGKSLIVSSKGDGGLAFYISFKTDGQVRLDFGDKTQVLSWFIQTFPEWGTIWRELYENATPPFIPRPIYCMPLDQTWESLPNCTLLGDAAHLMPPFAGEGVNMAMLDALELSECLLKIGHYEVHMRKRAAVAAQMSLENTDWMHREGALARMLAMFNASEPPPEYNPMVSET